jgi:phage shock protein C
VSEVKRLYRSRTQRWLAGVCGGLGQYLGLDPTAIRVLFVLLALMVGGGFLLYLLLWIIIPLEPETVTEVQTTEVEEVEQQ